MAETVDPRQALDSDDVAVRTAGARDLAAVGAVDDAFRLIEMAKSDKSPSVRLYAAAAAADIVYRVGLDADQRRRCVEAVQSFDPGRNPSLLMVFAAVVDRTGIDRLGRLMRDPRSDVRAGAFAAVKRMSRLPGAEAVLPAAVSAWLLAGKHPSDAVADLVRLTSEVGWTGMDDAIRAAASSGRAAASAVQEATDWMIARNDPASWVGLWAAESDDRITDWLYLERGHVWGPGGDVGPLTVTDGVGAVPGMPPVYRVRTGRTDDGPSEALKVGEVLLHRLPAREIVRLVEQFHEAFRSVPTVALGVARVLQPLEGASAVRARATALWLGGALREAETLLDTIVAGEKRVKADVSWLVANVKLGLGDLDSARDALRACLDNAPKKAGFRPEAEALLASLRG